MAQLMWWTILSSIVLMGCVAYLLRQETLFSPIISDAAKMQRYLYYGLSLMSVCAIPILKPLMISGKSFPKEYHRGELTLPQISTRLYVSSMVAYVLCETPTVFGLILTILTHNMNDFFLLGALSFLSLLANLPKYEEWEGWVRNLNAL